MTTTAPAITTLQFYPKRSAVRGYFALWYFTTLLIVWNILGHVFLGFEQSHIQSLVGVATAIILQVLLEWIDARASDRKPRFAGSWADLLNFLPPAIIPGLAVTMLLYPNARLMPVIFGVGVAICSKVIFRAPVGDGKTQHIFNPSNLGVVATLLLFPSIGVAPPYHFTENLTGMWHWALPGLVLATGIVVHALFTGRLTLVLTWLVAFIMQGELRSWYFETSWIVPLTPMTSAAFMVFTLYMIPDPATTPIKPMHQALFAIAIAAAYGVLLVEHVVYCLFIGLAIVCAMRGVGLYARRGCQVRCWGRCPSRNHQAQPAPTHASRRGAETPMIQRPESGPLPNCQNSLDRGRARAYRKERPFGLAVSAQGVLRCDWALPEARQPSR
jgi:hypothetical protein